MLDEERSHASFETELMTDVLCGGQVFLFFPSLFLFLFFFFSNIFVHFFLFLFLTREQKKRKEI